MKTVSEESCLYHYKESCNDNKKCTISAAQLDMRLVSIRPRELH